MNTDHRSLYNTRNWKFNKISFDKKIYRFRIEKPTDSSYLLWLNINSKLNHNWKLVYNEHGVEIQNCLNHEDKKYEYQTYDEYFNEVIELLKCNKLLGLVHVNQVIDDLVDSVLLEVLLPPTNLLNCLRYTPIKFKNKEDWLSYIIYQILCAIEQLHVHGIPHGAIYLHNVFINDQLTVRISLPEFDSCLKLTNCNSEEDLQKSDSDSEYTILTGGDVRKYLNLTPEFDANLSCHNNTLEQNTLLWTTGQISNLEYLLYLNRIAGRIYSDPNNHPMLPWVTDFTAQFANYRDFTLSKFRINKGDEQLDKMYHDQKDELERYEQMNPLEKQQARKESNKMLLTPTSAPKKFISTTQGFEDGVPPNPHHVSDVLSELSYYAYMARVTSVETLKKSYRTFYKPQEFRWNISKMYSWTPDECIPQFFLEPSILISHHEDMPDIELPSWCNNDPVEFIRYHRQILESPQVSNQLHHWIDLVFGYRLIGCDAIESKNVHRQFSDRNPQLTNNGLTILFRKPHPQRLCSNQSICTYFSSKAPTVSDKISENKAEHFTSVTKTLPDDYDPYAMMSYFKQYNSFIQDSCATNIVKFKEAKIPQVSLIEKAFQEDVLSVCCLIVELFYFDQLRADYIVSCKDVSQRKQTCLQLIQRTPSKLPRSFYIPIKQILTKCCDSIDSQSEPIPTIVQLKSSDDYFVFSRKFSLLYETMMIHLYYSNNCSTISNIRRYLDTQYHYCDLFLNYDWLELMGLNLYWLLNEQINDWFKFEHNTSQNEEKDEGWIEEERRDRKFGELIDVIMIILRRYGLMANKTMTMKYIVPLILSLYPKRENGVGNPVLLNCHVRLYQQTFLKYVLLRIDKSYFLQMFLPHLIEVLLLGQNVFCGPSSSNGIKIPAELQENKRFTQRSTWYVQFEDEEHLVNAIKNGVDLENVSLDSWDSDEVPFVEDDSLRRVSLQRNLSNSVVSTSVPTNDSDRIHNNEHTNDNSPPVPSSSSPFRRFRGISTQNKSMTNSLSTPKKVTPRPNLSQDCSKMSIASMSSASILWLSDLIGPLLTSQIILRDLLSHYMSQFRSLDMCLTTDELMSTGSNLMPCDLVTGTYESITQPDLNLITLLDTIRSIICLYGYSLIEYQIRYFLDNIFDRARTADSNSTNSNQYHDQETCTKKFIGISSAFICGLSFLKFLLQLIPIDDLETFIANRISDEYLPYVIRIIGTLSRPIPAYLRRIMLHKTIDLIYLISTRLNIQQIQQSSITTVFQLLFQLFNKVFIINANSDSQQIVSYRSIINNYDNKISESVDCQLYGLYSPLISMKTPNLKTEFFVNAIGETEFQITSSSNQNNHNNSTTNQNNQKSTVNKDKENLTNDQNNQNSSNNQNNKVDLSLFEASLSQLKEVITHQLASVLYITFSRLLGEHRFRNLINNHTLIHALMEEHEKTMNQNNENSNNQRTSEPVYTLADKTRQQQLREHIQTQVSSITMDSRRHLTGVWRQYWLHELGANDPTPFALKQMQLAKFTGHSNQIKGLSLMNCENGFLSFSKDRTVRLFSLGDVENTVSNSNNKKYSYITSNENVQDNTMNLPEVKPRFTYQHHKSVNDALFLEGLRLAASVDNIVHLWDPFVGRKIIDTTLGVSAPSWNLVTPVPPSQTLLAIANNEGRIITMDTRTGYPCFSFNLNIHSQGSLIPGSDFASSMAGIIGGYIRQIAVSPNGNLLLLGNTEGCMMCIDFRSCRLLGSWRAHQSEITQIKFLENNWCVTSSNDSTGRLMMTSLFRPTESSLLNLDTPQMAGSSSSSLHQYSPDIILPSNISTNASSSSSSSTLTTSSNTASLVDSSLGPIHSVMVLPSGHLLTGASQNKFGLFSYATDNLTTNTSVTKLSPSLYKNTVTASNWLLDNRLLLLGNDVGVISLWY